MRLVFTFLTIIFLIVILMPPMFIYADETVLETQEELILENRVITGVGIPHEWLYFPATNLGFVIHSPVFGPNFPPARLNFLINDGGFEGLEVIWDTVAINALDFNVIGETKIRYWLANPDSEFTFVDGFEQIATVDVREADAPCIVDMRIVLFPKYPDYSFIQFYTGAKDDGFLFNPKDPGAKFTFDYSPDEGMNWFDITEAIDYLGGDDFVGFYLELMLNDITNILMKKGLSELNYPAWFQLSANGKYSNVVIINDLENQITSTLGGDRTGTDRGGEKEEPSPTPTSAPSSVSTPVPVPAPIPTNSPLPSLSSSPLPSLSPSLLTTPSPSFLTTPSPSFLATPSPSWLSTPLPSLSPTPSSSPSFLLMAEPTSAPVPEELNNDNSVLKDEAFEKSSSASEPRAFPWVGAGITLLVAGGGAGIFIIIKKVRGR